MHGNKREFLLLTFFSPFFNFENVIRGRRENAVYFLLTVVSHLKLTLGGAGLWMDDADEWRHENAVARIHVNVLMTLWTCPVSGNNGNSMDFLPIQLIIRFKYYKLSFKYSRFCKLK